MRKYHKADKDDTRSITQQKKQRLSLWRQVTVRWQSISGRPRQKVRNEQNMPTRLFRMDRVIIDPGGITVIDYKTGKDKKALEKHRGQMRNYMRVLGEVYQGKTLSGIISFVDLGEVEKVG
jgi:ATP-dependent exoDNAse (exonuclease V) beta subunit